VRHKIQTLLPPVVIAAHLDAGPRARGATYRVVQVAIDGVALVMQLKNRAILLVRAETADLVREIESTRRRMVGDQHVARLTGVSLGGGQDLRDRRRLEIVRGVTHTAGGASDLIDDVIVQRIDWIEASQPWIQDIVAVLCEDL